MGVVRLIFSVMYRTVLTHALNSLSAPRDRCNSPTIHRDTLGWVSHCVIFYIPLHIKYYITCLWPFILMYISNQCSVIIIHLIIPDQGNTPVDEKELCGAWSQRKCKTVKIRLPGYVSDW